MKFLFLDIDGVLNSEYFYSLTASGDRSLVCESPSLDQFCKENLDSAAIDRVIRICGETGAEIVLSSSWRLDENVYDRLMPSGIMIYRKTPSLYWKYQTFLCRGEEIAEYLRQNPAEAYCILDDDSDMLDIQKDHFILVDSCFGLTDSDAEKAIEILGLKS